MNDAVPCKPRITRAEATKLLCISCKSVRRLQSIGQLYLKPEHYGHTTSIDARSTHSCVVAV